MAVVRREFTTWRKRSASQLLLAAGATLLLAACDSDTVTLPPSQTVVPNDTTPPTSMAVTGAITGTFNAPGARCALGGPAGNEVTIQGILAGGSYVLAFNAPNGSTDLATAGSSHVVVEFAPLQGAGNWGADPSRQIGSGTVVVNAHGGTVNLHLAAGPGSPSPAALDLAGTFGCSGTA